LIAHRNTCGDDRREDETTRTDPTLGQDGNHMFAILNIIGCGLLPKGAFSF